MSPHRWKDARRAVTLTILLLIACAPTEPPQSKPTAAKPVDAAIRTDRSRYAFQYGFYGPELTIVTTFKAPKNQTVYVVNCNGAMSTGLQRLVDGAWVDAWGAVTNSCLSQPIVIAPGEERTETIGIIPGAGAVIHPPGHPELIEPGTYRATWNNVLTSFDMNAGTGRPLGDDLPLEQRASAPFVVEAAPPRPAAITSIEPAAGTYVGRDTHVRVSLDYRRAPRSSPASLRLYVDGKDVTGQISSVATEDVPPSQVEIAFRPKAGWVSARHGVKVELDPRTTYSWQFIVSAD